MTYHRKGSHPSLIYYQRANLIRRKSNLNKRDAMELKRMSLQESFFMNLALKWFSNKNQYI